MHSISAVTDGAEPTFARLRYAFGGDRPSQTAHLPRSQKGFALRGEGVAQPRVVFHCCLPQS